MMYIVVPFEGLKGQQRGKKGIWDHPTDGFYLLFSISPSTIMTRVGPTQLNMHQPLNDKKIIK
jgi:hypothetical protein